MQELKDIWNLVLNLIEKEVTAVSFDLWIKTLEPLEIKGDKLILLSPSTTAKTQLIKYHSIVLKTCIAEVMPNVESFDIIDPTEKESYLKASEPVNSNCIENNIPQNNVNCFNAKYTFDKFVVGKSNQFVYAAARSVAEHPGTKYNPLFIYGGVGLGKTHLLHAIGNFLKTNRPDLKIMYATCEKFTNDYIESLRASKEGANHNFREKYRKLDVLMIDDIQFISNKTGTQEEFFHTFNDLYQNNKQIIISSDRPPKEIATLEDRLRSRFASGLIQDIQSPDFETRVAILQKKALQENYNVDSAVITFIAEKLDTNIREMEGLLQRVVFYSNLIGKQSASMAEAEEALKDQIDSKKASLSAKNIIDCTCKYYNISEQEIIGKKKNKEIVDPRQISIYIITEMLDLPLATIGQIFGGRDHTTIIHSRDKISELIKTSPRIKIAVTDIKSMVLKL
ncbi:MAG: chromosomal replication initiator protein DnaA [Clostridia bacterium]|jgi:chromosomal replication initiator protein|nr:chromosomal replication initiator protein DnaA [Clostridia bacterium]